MTVEGFPQTDSGVLAALATRQHSSVNYDHVIKALRKKKRVDADTYVPELGRRFEILELIRVDATGLVYKAFDNDLGGLVAVKVLPYFDISYSVETRFERDFKAMMGLHHPNILEVFDYGKTFDGAPYMVTELFEGEDLASVVDRLQQLSPPRAEIMFLQLADALAYAHGQGVIHRDIKPGNVLVKLDENGHQTVKLIDFGISKTVTENIPDDLRVAPDNSMFYISPEQIRGDVFDPRSDMYSLGCMTYEMLAGRPPFKDNDEHLYGKPERLRQKNSGSDVPERLEYCVLRCLEKQPLNRFKNAESLIYHMTSAVTNTKQQKLRSAVPWLKYLKILLCLASVLVPFLVSRFSGFPLWQCLTVYGMVAGLAILHAVQKQDLSYRLRKRGSSEE